MNVKNELFRMADPKYKDFHSKLIPSVPYDLIIGVRTPELRKFAKRFYQTGDSDAFLLSLPHKYYEENNLHCFLIEKITDFDRAISETERFLPYIDNWATADMFKPPVFRKNPQKIISFAYKWIDSDRTFTVRYGIKILMDLFSDDLYKYEYMEKVSQISSDEYYVNMMISWYFSTMLSKHYNDAVKFFEQKRLPVFVHNKGIQKAIESNRINNETKEYLKSLKVK